MLDNIILIAQAANPNVPAIMQVLPFILLMGVMIFLMFRSQKKQAEKRKAMISKVKTGDEVVTSGGIKGTVTKVKEKTFLIKIAEKVEIEVVQSGVGVVIGGEKTDE